VTLTAEQELLVCCARLHLDPSRSQRIRDLLAGPLNFDALLRTAHVHGMLPLLGRHLLAERRVDSLPPSAGARLRTAVREIAARNASLTAELVRVLILLRSAGILAVPFKGPVVALAAYGNVALRQFLDLDILVASEDLDGAAEILMRAGYRAIGPESDRLARILRRTGHNRQFARAESGSLIELHWRFGPGWFHFPLDLKILQPRLGRLCVAGTDLPVLDLEDTLLILCAHGTKHGWSRLEWICLVAELVRRHDAFDWARVASRASVVGARRIVALGLWLAQEVLDAPAAPQTASGPTSDPVVRSLGTDVAALLFQSGGQSADPWTIVASTFRARERSADRWRQVLQLAFEPTIADVTTLKLPRQLAWLYYVTRLARLTWTYGCVAVARRLAHRGHRAAPEVTNRASEYRASECR